MSGNGGLDEHDDTASAGGNQVGNFNPRFGIGRLPCPYCGFEAKESEVFTSPTRRSNVFGGEWWCESCGKNFEFDAIAGSWSFLSTPYDNPQINLGHQDKVTDLATTSPDPNTSTANPPKGAGRDIANE